LMRFMNQLMNCVAAAETNAICDENEVSFL